MPTQFVAALHKNAAREAHSKKLAVAQSATGTPNALTRLFFSSRHVANP